VAQTLMMPTAAAQLAPIVFLGQFDPEHIWLWITAFRGGWGARRDVLEMLQCLMIRRSVRACVSNRGWNTLAGPACNDQR